MSRSGSNGGLGSRGEGREERGKQVQAVRGRALGSRAQGWSVGIC